MKNQYIKQIRNKTLSLDKMRYRGQHRGEASGRARGSLGSRGTRVKFPSFRWGVKGASSVPRECRAEAAAPITVFTKPCVTFS